MVQFRIVGWVDGEPQGRTSPMNPIEAIRWFKKHSNVDLYYISDEDSLEPIKSGLYEIHNDNLYIEIIPNVTTQVSTHGIDVYGREYIRTETLDWDD